MLLDIDHPVNLPSNNVNYEEISRGSEGFVHDGGGGEGGGGVVGGGGGEEGLYIGKRQLTKRLLVAFLSVACSIVSMLHNYKDIKSKSAQFH